MRSLKGPVPALALLAACGTAATAPAGPKTVSPSVFAADQAATRTILEELVRIDTSRGNETKGLEPIARRFREANIPFEIVESAPGRGNLVARIKGTGAKKPLLLLAHVDVVPVEGQPWTSAPFEPIEKDGFLTARGINDDKSMMASITVVALELAKAADKPSRDVIVAFTAGEETGGEAGVGWLLAHRRPLIDAEIALNEGAAIILSKDGERVLSANFGVAEKTFQSFKLVVAGRGGHSATPPPAAENAITKLARALVKVGEHSFEPRILPATAQQFAFAATHEPGPLGEALARASKTAPKLNPEDARVIFQDRLYASLSRTQCVATMLKGSPQDNVLPTSAEAIVNCRLLPDDRVDATRAALERVVADPDVKIVPVAEFGTTNGSIEPLDGPVPAAVRAAAARVFPKAAVIGSLSPGTTDSRLLRGAGIHAYGMSTSPMTLEEGRAGRFAHGPDERRIVRWIGPGTSFLREIVRELVR